MRVIGLAGRSGSGKTTLVAKLGADARAARRAGAEPRGAARTPDALRPRDGRGFKRDSIPKVHRADNGKRFLIPDDPAVVALASDREEPSTSLPRVHLDDVEAIVDLVLTHAMTT